MFALLSIAIQRACRNLLTARRFPANVKNEEKFHLKTNTNYSNVIRFRCNGKCLIVSRVSVTVSFCIRPLIDDIWSDGTIFGTFNIFFFVFALFAFSFLSSFAIFSLSLHNILQFYWTRYIEEWKHVAFAICPFRRRHFHALFRQSRLSGWIGLHLCTFLLLWVELSIRTCHVDWNSLFIFRVY